MPLDKDRPRVHLPWIPDADERAALEADLTEYARQNRVAIEANFPPARAKVMADEAIGEFNLATSDRRYQDKALRMSPDQRRLFLFGTMRNKLRDQVRKEGKLPWQGLWDADGPRAPESASSQVTDNFQPQAPVKPNPVIFDEFQSVLARCLLELPVLEFAVCWMVKFLNMTLEATFNDIMGDPQLSKLAGDQGWHMSPKYGDKTNTVDRCNNKRAITKLARCLAGKGYDSTYIADM